jgi:hypothetical protein
MRFSRRAVITGLSSLPVMSFPAVAALPAPATPLIGFGINSVGSRLKGCPFVDRATGSPALRISDRTTLDFVSDYSSLYKSLDVSVDASFSGFAGRASASVNIAQSCQWDDYSSYLVLKRYVTTEEAVLNQPRLRAADATLYSQNPDAFLDRYGDEYVSNVVFGGALYLIIKITASSRKSAQQLRASASASYGTMSGSAQVNQIVNAYATHGGLSYNAQQLGVTLSASPPVQQPGMNGSDYIDRVFSYIQLFKSYLQDGIGTPLFFETKSYSTADGSPNFAKDFSAQDQWLTDSARNRDKIEDRRLLIEYAQENPSLFKPPSGQALSDRIDDINKKLDALSDYVTVLFRNPARTTNGPPGGEASLPEAPQGIPVPAISLNVIVQGKYGARASGSGGQMTSIPFTDPPSSISVQLFTAGKDVHVWFRYVPYLWTNPPQPLPEIQAEGGMTTITTIGNFSVSLRGADADAYSVRYRTDKVKFGAGGLAAPHDESDTAYMTDGQSLYFDISNREELRGLEIDILPRFS